MATFSTPSQDDPDDTHIGATPTVRLRRRTRRISAAAFLGLSLIGGAVGGGVVGAHWFAPTSVQAAQTTSITAQPIAQVTAANVASGVYTSASPSVVEVNVTAQVGFRQATASGTGSGFVVDTSGLIVTNNHVVAQATSVTVMFSTGEERTATVLGTDTVNDLALLQVTDMPTGIPALTFADSDMVIPGETAIAIGSPFGLEQTVTEGIVSAVNRTWSSPGEVFQGLLQTDAPINPGNSGGPLLNADGEVIGITTLIESPIEGNVGVGFAVPSNTIVKQLTALTTEA